MRVQTATRWVRRASERASKREVRGERKRRKTDASRLLQSRNERTGLFHFEMLDIFQTYCIAGRVGSCGRSGAEGGASR